MKRTSNKSYRNQKGAVAVEFALVLPLLILLIYGMIEFGLLFHNKQVLANASREGARLGITLTDETDETIEFKIKHIIKNYYKDEDGNSKLINLNGPDSLEDGDIDVIPADPDAGNFDLSVTVSFDYNFLFGKILGFENGTTVTAQTIMRMEPTS